MKTRTDLIYLTHILDACTKIADFIGKVSFEEFDKLEEKQSAVIRQLEIIGEATKRLSSELTEKHSDYPWSLAARMRDKLVHDYFEIDLQQVWNTAKKDVPEYKIKVQEVLASLK